MTALISCAAAAELAGLPESTIRRWTRENRCPGLFRDGRAVRIHRDTFIDGLTRMSQSSTNGNVLLAGSKEVRGPGHDARRSSINGDVQPRPSDEGTRRVSGSARPSARPRAAAIAARSVERPNPDPWVVPDSVA